MALIKMLWLANPFRVAAGKIGEIFQRKGYLRLEKMKNVNENSILKILHHFYCKIVLNSSYIFKRVKQTDNNFMWNSSA